MTNYDELLDVDERYKAFENHERGLLISLAGPGTGKTYSLLRRIRSLTENRGVSASSIAYLTFIREINKAFVVEYEEEFSASVPETERPRISTLHSFACRILRNMGHVIGYDGSLHFTSIASKNSNPSSVFCTDLIPFVSHLSLTTPARIRQALVMLKRSWQADESPEELANPIPELLEITLHLARSYRLIDWDQAIPLAHELFNTTADHPRWIQQIEHYLIDEYQDFNRAEQAFIISLASYVESTVIVGDDCQSIYSSRGGSPDGILDLYFSGEHDTVSLLRCRRSRANILNRVNALLEILRPGSATLLPYHEGGTINSYKFKSSKAEIEFLTDYLKSRIDEIPVKPQSKDGVVCLFPSHKSLEFYFDQLRESVSCFQRGSNDSDRREWLTLLMQLYCQPYQRFVERLILETIAEVKPSHKKLIVETILEKDQSPVTVISNFLADGTLKGKVESGAIGFVNACDCLSSRNLDDIADLFASHMQIPRERVLHELTAFDEDFTGADQDEHVGRFCDRLLPETAYPVEDPRAVLFLTMHGSKGLSKRVVVMPGLEDAWLPGSASGDDLSERARLFFVALSRATDHVQISYPLNRARKDPLNFPLPGRSEVSRFVTESQIPTTYHA